MALTPEQQASLVSHRASLARNESGLATARTPADVAAFTKRVAEERVAIARLEALITSPPPGVPDEVVAQILSRIGALERMAHPPVTDGPKGKPGDQGQRGDVGEKGPAGEKGPRGDAGVSGGGASSPLPQPTRTTTDALSVGLGRLREGLVARAEALSLPAGSEASRSAEARSLVAFAAAVEQLEAATIDPAQVRTALATIGFHAP